MSELQVIEMAVHGAARRQRWQAAGRGFWQGFAVGAGLWLTALAAYKIFPLPLLTLAIAGGVGGLLAAGGFLTGFLRPRTLLETARCLDLQQSLQERLSTALELAPQTAEPHWKQLVLADAAQHARQLNLRRLLPYHLPRVTRWAALILALSAGLGFVPEYRSKEFLQRQREAQNIRETGRQMAQLVRKNIEHRSPSLGVKESMEKIAHLGDEFARAKLTRSEALRNLASATDKLKQENKQLATSPALKRLEQAARSAGNTGAPNADALQKQVESLQKSLGDKAATRDALDQLKKDLEDLKQAAKGLADKEGGAADAAREQLAQSAAELAKKAESMGLPLTSLEEAIAALAGNQIDQFLRDLNFTEIELERLQAMAQTLQQLQQQAEKLGKDLAEQLKNGQAQAAQATLQKMIEQLKQSNLSPEQLEKILAEVAEAVNPGKEYGKVGEYLAKATQQLKQSEKADAALSLADAAKELERLLDQLGDAQSLMATLDALQRAQMCIGNCQGWGLCRGPGNAGQGGGPGGGVGTWADDSRWLDLSEIKDRWDNSGIVRPDQDPRGITDRGEAKMSDSFLPTKVTGKISPGGPMPSITLKGVSIKERCGITLMI